MLVAEGETHKGREGEGGVELGEVGTCGEHELGGGCWVHGGVGAGWMGGDMGLQGMV